MGDPWEEIGQPAVYVGRRALRTAIAQHLESTESVSLGKRGREMAFLLGAVSAAEARLIELTGSSSGREARKSARDELHELSERIMAKRIARIGARTRRAVVEHPSEAPEPRSQSVRALRGGLPTLGKRRR
jgi:hypothetical protein